MFDVLCVPGVGTLTWPDGVMYEGDFVGGKLLGKGTYRWPDGSVYSGGILNGKREGEGKFESSGGQVFEGQWKDGNCSDAWPFINTIFSSFFFYIIPFLYAQVFVMVQARCTTMLIRL